MSWGQLHGTLRVGSVLAAARYSLQSLAACSFGHRGALDVRLWVGDTLGCYALYMGLSDAKSQFHTSVRVLHTSQIQQSML